MSREGGRGVSRSLTGRWSPGARRAEMKECGRTASSGGHDDERAEDGDGSLHTQRLCSLHTTEQKEAY